MTAPRGRSPLAVWLCFVAGAAACGDTVDGLSPVGGEEPSTATLERFARRLHLDLTGRPATDDYLADAVAELGGETRAATSAAARAALADRLIDSEDFAQTTIDELTNRVFGGEDPDNGYSLLCAITRDEDPRCAECGPAAGDPCTGCDCAPLVELADDRQGLLDAPTDLAGDATTAAIERRFAGSRALAAFSAPAALVDRLFETFLGRPAEADEQVNAESMTLGSFIPGSPAGLLFHRHGANFQDFIDILFDSEVYRDAATSAVFERYLGRPARLAEMAHFSAELDADDPDVRLVIRAVVSSQEYFEQ
jgi:hypothetical protein